MEIPLRLTVVIDGIQRGEVDTLYQPASRVLRLSANGILRYLDEEIPAAAIDGLRKQADADGHLALAALQGVGLSAVFDEPGLRVRVSIPARVRATREIPLRTSAPTATGAIPPADRSAFLNMRSSVTTAEDAAAGTQQTATIGLDGAANVRGHVLEVGGAWNNTSAPAWRRSGIL